MCVRYAGVPWCRFRNTCAKIDRFRRAQAEKQRAAAKAQRAAEEHGAARARTAAEEAFLIRARKKFAQMDGDGDGVLSGDELRGVVGWVWDAFHPGGEELAKGKKEELGRSLLGLVDKNHDGQLDFEEFAGWPG